MPTNQAPTEVNEPNRPAATPPDPGNPVAGERQGGSESASPVVRGSRWIDYDTHELLTMISELEDERRWARLREGVWIAILVHLILISMLTWIPRYIFKVPVVVDKSQLNQHKDFTYLDTPWQAPKVAPKPVPKHPLIDKQTMEAMKKTTPEAPQPEPAPQAAPQPAAPAPVQPAPQTQSQLEAPRPAAVPARPNFAMGSQNPADQLRDAMKGASRNSGESAGSMGSGGLARHPGAGTGGVEVLSDTQGVDFSGWLQRWYYETRRTWDPLIPDEVNAPILKKGQVLIRFKVLPNGRLMDPMILEGRSGDTALDRAAWGALTGSNYPPLPKEFHGPYLELRALFMYNLQPQ
jgi:hypothetical protein